MRIILAAVALSLFWAGEVAAQGSFSLRLRSFNSDVPTPSADTLIIGRDPRASYCVDPYVFIHQGQQFQEFELPPPPPAGTFDVRSGAIRSGNGGCSGITDRTQGLKFDIRGSISRAQIDTFRIRFDPGATPPMNFSWPGGLAVFCDSMKLRVGGATPFDVNMFTNQNATIDDPDLTLVNFYMYGAPGVNPLSPAIGSTVPPNPTLRWNNRPSATRYRLQVASDSLFTALVVHDSTVIDTSRTLASLAAPFTYYWRVAAGNVLGFGAFSPTWRFTTGDVPAAPVLLAPPNGASGQPSAPTLRWGSVSGAQTYHLQLSTDSTFASVLLNDSTLTDTSRAVSGLSFSTKYFWRVRGKNGVGTGPFTSPFSFTTQLQPPAAPTLLSPPNGQTNSPTTLTMSWTSVSGAANYRLQVATNASFTGGIVLDDSTLTGTSLLVSSLQNLTQYFWRVNARNAGGTGSYSAVFNFTTIVAAPSAPALTSPPDGAVNVSLVPTLMWGAVPTAASYHVQVARDSLFTLLVTDDTTITGTSRQIGQLLSNTLYYWHVRAKNAGGVGPFSSRFRFTTTEAPPAPFLVLPEDSARRVSVTPGFTWSHVAGATSYQLQIGTDVSFSTLIVNDSTIVDTTKVAGPLPYGARLLWRTRARNSSGASEYAAPRVFTVMLEPPPAPSQIAPANNLVNAPVTQTFRWSSTILTSGYHLQFAFDTLMTNVFKDTTASDTSIVLSVCPSMANYWRVRSFNTEQTYSPFSAVRRFTTGNLAPAIPVLVSPANGDTGITRRPTLCWSSSPCAFSYRVQVSTSISFSQIIVDDSTVTSTSFTTPVLPPRVSCFWRVRSQGASGGSQYSAVRSFTTGSLIVGVAEDEQEAVPSGFALLQNYPNPFNPSTTIPFTVAAQSFVTLKIFDLLGREVQTLIEQEMTAGSYSARWNGQTDNGATVPSGVYFVRFSAMADNMQKSFRAVRKLALLK